MKRRTVLECTICHNRNYSTYKSATKQKRLELNKYCKKCRTHTNHRETK